MSAHALLSPSSAHRWLNCPRAPRLEATLPDRSTVYSKEGTLAHSVCEISAKVHFGQVTNANYKAALKRYQKNELWDSEMLSTAETYVEHLADKAMGFQHQPVVAFETRVDITDYVPDAFGRCDCIMFSGDTLIITDYKHGKGEPVDAEENPQLMLYALGALKLYRPFFGDSIQNVTICIDQPRIDSYQTWTISTSDLVAWGESIKPKAQMAYAGFGEFKAGTWCKFCRANGLCSAQAEQHLSALDDFKDSMDRPDELLSPERMSEALKKGETLVAWYGSLKEKALETILAGTPIPNFKLVEGKSSREWSDQDKALETLEENGIDRAIIYDTAPKSLSQLEKLIGKKKFGELVGDFVVKPQGKPTLASSSDRRKTFNSAVSDFKDVTGGQENV